MRIGIIGTGRIAKRFVTEAAEVPQLMITAVYNPHEGSAERYVAEQGLSGAGAFTRLGDFFTEVDAAYIASPHETHEEYIREALQYGKHVLCEKPMALRAAAAAEFFSLARQKKLVLMEGIKTAYCPGFRKVQELIVRGDIGAVRYVEACFTKLENPMSRELTDRIYGGSFLELGSYVIFPILRIFGTDVRDVRIESLRAENGLDLFTKISLRFGEWMATGICGLGVKADGRLMAAGSNGYILVTPPWWKTTHIEVHYEDPGRVDVYEEPYEGDGLRYELREFVSRAQHLAAGEADGTTRMGEAYVAENESLFAGVKEGESIALAGMMERFCRNRGS